MSATAPEMYPARPLRARKFCTACGTEHDADEFYTHHVNPRTGNAILSSRCKRYETKLSIARWEERRRKVMAVEVEAISMVVLDRLPDQTGQGKSVYLRRREDRISVTVGQEPAFNAPPPERFTLPEYNATPQCPRGKHPWPLESLCRGYDLLGCGGYGPHVHRKCLVHAAEIIEQAPSFVMARRNA